MKNEDRGELTAVSDGRRRPTNHERYLGTPELAAATTVEPQRNEDGSRWVVVWHDGVRWHIEEYDGLECVAEDHRTWG